MRKGSDFLRSAAQISQDGNIPLPGMPLIEICDRCRVLIENHQSVVGYDRHEVLIKVRFGLVRVYGDRLHLSKMSKDQIIITGKIFGVNLQEC